MADMSRSAHEAVGLSDAVVAQVWHRDELLARVVDVAKHSSVRDVEVLAASAEVRDDLRPDETVISLLLTLSDPQSGLETWPLESIQELRSKIRGAALAQQLPYDIAIQLKSASEPGGAEDPVGVLSDQLAHGDR